ncbi:T9SS type A sorting domain-containing protein [Hymenobacter sp. BT683]|uniref:T9SS type A sorting domain-containing protein n=1 Tax=Hymenobacter jeongseonensis TaxID=2791027 RepID=A0ABS0IMV1_9BACT|nr:T9SS type A sorting domain-containing protein [Hymenobacter jeongseonensis]MBF9239677.1 T9SS type A sorting domain-containing protein [Hymenobacter jeongseonensis]
MLRGAGETPTDMAAGAARVQEFAGHLYQQSVTPLGPYSFYANIKYNHTLITAAALGLAAVVLSEASSADAAQQPATWAGTGFYHLDSVLGLDAQCQSESTQVGGYAEGPYHLKYGLLNCLTLFRAMGDFLPDGRLPYTYGGQHAQHPQPVLRTKIRPASEWLTAIRMPEGRFPALEDSYVDMDMPELALTGRVQYVQPLYLSKLTGKGMAPLTGQLRDSPVDMRAAWLAAEAPATLRPAFPQPVRHLLTVTTTGPEQDVTLQLFDGLGREVARQPSHHQPAQLDVSQLTPGLYYLVGHDASGQPLPGRQKIVWWHRKNLSGKGAASPGLLFFSEELVNSRARTVVEC